MNNREKMRYSNMKIKKWLINNNYKNIHLFPHSRFSKDVIIDEEGFDGICTKANNIIMFQCKTNVKPTKKLIQKYKELGNKYGIVFLFLSNFDRKGVTCYGL